MVVVDNRTENGDEVGQEIEGRWVWGRVLMSGVLGPQGAADGRGPSEPPRKQQLGIFYEERLPWTT